MFLDFSKAFDTVNHNILMRRLEAYGVRGVAYKLIRDYLTDRTHFATINRVKSKPKQ